MSKHVEPIFGFTIGSKCNLKCKFCYNKLMKPTELSINDILAGYNQIKDLDCTLSFIGGEPLIYKWIHAALMLPKPKIVFTNGILLDSSYLKYKNIKWNVSPHTEELSRCGISFDEYMQNLYKLADAGMHIHLVLLATDSKALSLVNQKRLAFSVVSEFDANHNLYGLDIVNRYSPSYIYENRQITLEEAFTKKYVGCRCLDFEYDAATKTFRHSCTNERFTKSLMFKIKHTGITCDAGKCWLDCWVNNWPKDNLVIKHKSYTL